MTSIETNSTPEIKDSLSSNIHPTITLHEHGDILLIIGENDAQQPVRVSLAMLRAASPVWNAMFNPQWKESEVSEVLLPDDNPEAMLLVLRIAHLRFRELPQKKAFSFQSLLDLAIICDKYDLVGIVRPFLDLHHWAEPYFYTSRSSTYYPAWLFVAWTFGYSQSFDSLAKVLAFNVEVTPLLGGSGVLVKSEQAQIVEQDMPPGILESILQVRKVALSSMMKACYSALDKLLSSHTCYHKDSNGIAVDSSKCRSMILGSFISQLIAQNLYPERKNGDDLTLSVRTVQNILESIKIHTYTSHDYASIVKYSHTFDTSWSKPLPKEQKDLVDHGVTSHEKCVGDINLVACARRVVAQMASPTLESHRRHMEKQAKE